MLSKWLLTLALACAFMAPAAGLIGCEEGPAEEAGREIDEAAEEVEDAVD